MNTFEALKIIFQKIPKMKRILIIYIAVTFIIFSFLMVYRTLSINNYNREKISSKNSQIYELENKLKDFEALKIFIKRAPRFLKEKHFDENWTGLEDNKEKILRLNDYGMYALNKEDYKYAKNQFQESIRIAPTLEALYYLGFSEYMLNNNSSVIENWKKFVGLDEKKKYSDILFYIAIVFYEIGDIENSKKYLSLYLRIQ